MFKYNCLNPIASVGLDLFSGDYEKVEDLGQADAALVRSAAMHELELPDSLLAVARAGAGVNNIPLDKCAEKGIVVFNTPGANANGVKELVIAGMLLASRDILGGVNYVLSDKDNPDIAKAAEKEKKKFAGTEIQGKKLGIIGLGAIGVKVANVAKHLGMEVYGYDPYVSVNAAWNLSRDVKHVLNVEDIYPNCDIITIHVPLLDSTRGMINADAISKMKDGVILINAARGAPVDTKDLIEAVESGKIGSVGTDCCEGEDEFIRTDRKYDDLVVNHDYIILKSFQNTIVTPHVAFFTDQAVSDMVESSVKSVVQFAAGEDTPLEVH